MSYVKRIEILEAYKAVLAEHNGDYVALMESMIEPIVATVVTEYMCWPNDGILEDTHWCKSCLGPVMRHERRHNWKAQRDQHQVLNRSELTVDGGWGVRDQTDVVERCAGCGVMLECSPGEGLDMMKCFTEGLTSRDECFELSCLIDSGYFSAHPGDRDSESKERQEACELLKRLTLRTFREKMLGIGLLWIDRAQLESIVLSLSNMLARAAWSKKPPARVTTSWDFAIRISKGWSMWLPGDSKEKDTADDESGQERR